MAVEGRKLDTSTKWREGVCSNPGSGSVEVQEVGIMSAGAIKNTVWTAVLRAWGQEPEMSVSERLRALEEQG